MKNIDQTLNNNDYKIKNGVYYYINTPQNTDLIPRGDINNATNHSLWSNWRKANFWFLKNEMKHITSGVLLDLGAGPQQFRELTDRFEVCAVDAVADPGIDIVCDIGKPLPFKNDIFDVVFMSNVLEHVYRPQALLSEVARVLRPGGLLVGTVPFLMQSHQRPHDYYRYTDICLNDLLVETGFSDIRIKPVGSALDVLTSMHRKLLTVVPATPKNRFLKRIFRLISKLFIWCYKIAFRDMNSSESFTEGYGFSASKSPNRTQTSFMRSEERSLDELLPPGTLK